MSDRSPLARFLLGLGFVAGGLVALAGALWMGGSGLAVVIIAGLVAAALGMGLARETPTASRGMVREAGVKAGAAAVGCLLLVTGIGVLLGAVVAAVVTGVAAVATGAWWLHRRAGHRAADRHRSTPSAAASSGSPWAPPVLRPVPAPAPWSGPVSALPTSHLGREWLRTSAVLARRLEPAARQTIVDRRRQVLDELEQRDPVGFARWVATGPAPGSDPADFVQGAIRGDQEAGNDAA